MQRVIIDTDLGLDDLFGILMALGSGRLEVLGITTVCGTSIENTKTKRAPDLRTGRCTKIPVYAGAAHPLSGP
jgi:purine nucleosidase